MKQYQSEDIKDISKALCIAQSEFKPVVRDKEVTVKTDKGTYKFKYAELASVVDAIKDSLNKNDLVYSHSIQATENGQQLVCTLYHSSGQWISSSYPLVGDFKAHQAIGSAMSYGRRYTLSSLVGVVSEDDDDGVIATAKKESAASRNKRYAAIKTELQTSDDPAATWHEHAEEINEFKESDPTFYDDLVRAGAKRKEELYQDEQMKQQLGEK